MMSTNSGVVELSVPAKELLILLPAIPNNMAGKKYPKKPVSSKGVYCLVGILLADFMAHGSNTTLAIKTLPAPSSTALSTPTIFFIKIKDKPQSTANSNKPPHTIKVLLPVFLLKVVSNEIFSLFESENYGKLYE